MLIEPGPIAPLDLAYFETALARLPPFDLSGDTTPALLAAADAIDGILVTAGPVDPPDPEEDVDTLALDDGVAATAVMVDQAAAGFPADVNDNLDVGQKELLYFRATLQTSLVGLSAPNPGGPVDVGLPIRHQAEAFGVDIAAEADATQAAIDALPDDPPAAGGAAAAGARGATTTAG